MKTLEEFIQAYAPRATSEKDKRLLEILVTHQDDIADHFLYSQKSVMLDYYKKNPKYAPKWVNECGDISEIDFWGPEFHKGFRQVDIISDDGKLDMEVWNLIREADEFWNVADEFFKS